jgi:predicted SprT family Zn-dependent metalloprotease
MAQTLAHLVSLADIRRNIVWDKLRAVYPDIQIRYPAIIINKRLKTRAGQAYTYKNPQYIEISYELLMEHRESLINWVVPHELAHLVAYTKYDDNMHGNGWKTVMIRDLGLPAEIYHNFDNTNWEARKAARNTK